MATPLGATLPLKDVPRTLVWELARWLERRGPGERRNPADPEEVDRQAAEPELRPVQLDADSLPDYVLDDVLDDT